MSSNPPTMDDFFDNTAGTNSTITPGNHRGDEESYLKGVVPKASTLELANLSSSKIDLASASLPHPESLERSPSSRKLLWRRKSIAVLAGAAVLLILVVVMSVLISSKRKSSSSTSRASTSELSFSDVVDWIATNGISSRNEVLTEGTPQNRAAMYLTTSASASLLGDTKTSSEAYLEAAKYIMAVLYYATNGDRWKLSLNFMGQSDNVCDWRNSGFAIDEGGYIEFEPKGVLCDRTGTPTGLDLEWNNISGSLPTEIGFLTTLKALDIEYNKIDGALPTELCQLTDLILFWASDSGISGTLPKCGWPEMSTVRFSNNELTGEIPAEYCSMKNLVTILADKNDLKGPIPKCGAQDWPKIKVFSFSDNLLTGTLPTEFGSLSQMTSLFIDGNVLNGNPISTINSLDKLRLLYIEENFFTGIVDDNFARGFDDLLAMDISENNFTSTTGLPLHLFELPQLVVLDMSMNEFKGTIPDNIPVQDNLQFFSVFKNQMEGTIPSSLANLQKLVHIDVSNNDFTGPMTPELFNQTLLHYIYLSENNFTEGPIPEMVEMEHMRELSLKNTNRNGPLPSFEGYDNLVLIVLDNNRLTGPVPENYGRLPLLRHLLLGRNPGLSGAMPEFFEPGNLGTLLVDKTGVSGDFSSICNLPTISGAVEIPTDVIVLADCSDADSAISCECCSCCFRDQAVCSEPVVTSLDWTWEQTLRRTARDFAINYTLFEDSQSVSPS